MADIVTATTKINNEILTYVPAVIAGVQAAETSTAAGSQKKQAVIDAIIAGAKSGETSTNANVAAIAGTIDLVVSILNALGVFRHK